MYYILVFHASLMCTKTLLLDCGTHRSVIWNLVGRPFCLLLARHSRPAPPPTSVSVLRPTFRPSYTVGTRRLDLLQYTR